MEIELLDTLHIYTGKFPIGGCPTEFTCKVCGSIDTLENMMYEPYEHERVCNYCFSSYKLERFESRIGARDNNE